MSEATQKPTGTERELALLRMGLRSLRKEFSEKLQSYRLSQPVTDNDMEVVEHFKRDIAEIDALIAKYAAPAVAQQEAAQPVAWAVMTGSKVDEVTTIKRQAESWLPYDSNRRLVPLYAAPISQQASRNAVLEEAAKVIESDTIQWGQQRMGRLNASHFAFAIRALKNDPAQQDSKDAPVEQAQIAKEPVAWIHPSDIASLSADPTCSAFVCGEQVTDEHVQVFAVSPARSVELAKE